MLYSEPEGPFVFHCSSVIKSEKPKTNIGPFGQTYCLWLARFNFSKKRKKQLLVCLVLSSRFHLLWVILSVKTRGAAKFFRILLTDYGPVWAHRLFSLGLNSDWGWAFNSSNKHFSAQRENVFQPQQCNSSWNAETTSPRLLLTLISLMAGLWYLLMFYCCSALTLTLLNSIRAANVLL